MRLLGCAGALLLFFAWLFDRFRRWDREVKDEISTASEDVYLEGLLRQQEAW